MDNPQHYQPLSYALHPPLVPAPSRSPYSSSAAYTPPTKPATVPGPTTRPQMHREEQEEEEEQDDDDEGVVEEQLNENERERHRSTPPTPPRTDAVHSQPPLQIVHDTSHTGENKRRPGRPRGSKNRKPRAPHGGRESQPATQGGIPGPPSHPEINPQNQQYYEFQWRILNLCAEFYGAAEELVKATNPLVIAQCYHMGPAAKLDPLVMLAEAKRNCDSLLANPSSLVANPPPPMYPVLPTLYSSGATAPSSSAAASQAAAPPGTVITNPQSFVVPLGSQPNYGAHQYPVYATGQYPTTPYYQYPYPPPGYYPALPPAASSSSGPSASAHAPLASTPAPAPPTQPILSNSSTPAPPALNASSTSGAWAEDEVERLRRLAEESKSINGNGEIDWEHVIRNFGDKRTRHQILIKATTIGLKESSTRGVKRRRENEPPTETSTAATSISSPAMASLPTQPPATNQQPTIQQQSTSSPTHSQPASTPNASPSLQNQRPSSAKGSANPPPAATNSMPWPMPTVAAVNTASPIIPSSSTTPGHDQQRTSYYRPRPNQTADPSNKPALPHQHSSAAPVHHYMYTPNGHSGSRPADSR